MTTVDSSRTTTSGFATRFFLAGLGIFSASAALAAVLAVAAPPVPGRSGQLPWVFAVTTVLLGIASGLLHRGLHMVRLERQRPFRRCLMYALVAGASFVGIQAYGLICLIVAYQPVNPQTGVTAFAFVFAAMHGLHVIVALLFLLFVSLRALADRYDHEYYWGVTVTTWFWHALGIVWLAILLVIIIAA